MSSQHTTATTTETPATTSEWRGGVAAGLLGGAVMGIMLTMQMTPVIQHAIPAMYGLDGGLAGWVAHMSHSAVLGVGFAAVATVVGVDSTLKYVGLGVAYGVALWILLAAVVMPIWLGAVGFSGAPPLPNFNPMSLLGHVVYGALVGAAFPAVEGRL